MKVQEEHCEQMAEQLLGTLHLQGSNRQHKERGELTWPK